MHVAQFVHRYPPALGGAEAYTARLCEYLTARGDTVRVWTTTAAELQDMWRPVNPERQRRGSSTHHPVADAPGSPDVIRFLPLHFPLRRYVLKALALL